MKQNAAWPKLRKSWLKLPLLPVQAYKARFPLLLKYVFKVLPGADPLPYRWNVHEPPAGGDSVPLELQPVPMVVADRQTHGPDPTRLPAATGSYVGWTLALSTLLPVGVITPDDVTADEGAMHAVNALLATAKFGVFAAASHAEAVQMLLFTQSRPGITGLDKFNLV